MVATIYMEVLNKVTIEVLSAKPKEAKLTGYSN